jgi:hypothetical protein
MHLMSINYSSCKARYLTEFKLPTRHTKAVNKVWEIMEILRHQDKSYEGSRSRHPSGFRSLGRQPVATRVDVVPAHTETYTGRNAQVIDMAAWRKVDEAALQRLIEQGILPSDVIITVVPDGHEDERHSPLA